MLLRVPLLLALLGVVVTLTPLARAQPGLANITNPSNNTEPESMPIESPNSPTEPPASMPQQTPPTVASNPTAPPLTPSQEPIDTFYCIGNRPNPLFWCSRGVWVYFGDVTIGPGQMFESMDISGPTFIEGTVNVIKYGSLTFSPPLQSLILPVGATPWNPKATSLLSLSSCFHPSSFPPQIKLSSASANTITNDPAITDYTFWGIETACNSDALSTRWNADFGDAQPVADQSECWVFINQYKTFTVLGDPIRSTARIRLQWRSDCRSPRTKESFDTSLLIPIVAVPLFIIGIIIYVSCSVVYGQPCGSTSGSHGGGGGGGGDVEMGDAGGGGGGGTDTGGDGGGGWTSSAAGNWD